MIAALRPYQRRIAYAIALSVLAHVLLLWWPHLHLPAVDADLHPLTARLEPLPDRPKTKPAPKPPKPRRAQIAAPSIDKPAPISASAVAAAETVAASSTPATTELDAASAPAAAEATALPSVTPSPAPSSKPALLPKHAQLIFAVHRGENGMYVGEVQHRLDISDNRYSIIASTRTAGVARWFKSYNLNQSSIGTVSLSGLQPESFVEEKNDSGNLTQSTARFDWTAHVVHFSDGGESELGATAQDTLSLLYQFSALSLRGELVALNICNGRKLEQYLLEIVTEEITPTSMGDLRTLHLRKLHTPGEAGLDIWLGREYRMLPVKMQYIEPDGTVAATITITDIRVSDE